MFMVQEEDAQFEHMVATLQSLIDEQEQELYSATVLREARTPQNLRRMNGPDAQAIVRGWCGDTMEIYLRLRGTVIHESTFMTDGCGPSIACGSMLTQMIQGRTLDEAGALRPLDLLQALDGLPEDSRHCAQLAVMTLQQAIETRRVGEGDDGQPPPQRSA
jgi:nitrogen fixation NifU-like protein